MKYSSLRCLNIVRDMSVSMSLRKRESILCDIIYTKTPRIFISKGKICNINIPM